MQNSMNLETARSSRLTCTRCGLSGSGMSNFSYATAIGMFNSLINLILIISVNQISRKVSDTSLW